MTVSAQQFETSTAAAPKWYFIQVKGTGDNAGRVVTEENGKITGQPVTNGLLEKAKQLWRIEATSNATRYEIINKNSGKKLDIIYDGALGERIAVTSETPSTVWTILTAQTEGYSYLRIVTQPSGGVSGAGYLTQGGTTIDFALYFTKNTPVSDDAQFQFISIDVPIISTDKEISWLTVFNARGDLSGKCLTEIETTADLKLSMQEVTANNHHQQWKIINNPASKSSVNFVNRATGHQIGSTPIHNIYNYIQYVETETNGWTIEPLGNGQYEVHTGPAAAGKYWNAAIDGEIPANYVAGGSFDTGFAWKFQLTDEESTAIYAPDTNPVRIWVENRRIRVEGAEQYRVYTIYGTSIAGNRELPTGIYLVTVKGKTAKIFVK
ncbi:hypothetical protein AGMMS50239_21680 [Bacteroidia bacterium]|nr:hypothetical protein AGMMS50239_21680 [Bacteroidia bacterium]